jgi:hypothetical protein
VARRKGEPGRNSTVKHDCPSYPPPNTHTHTHTHTNPNIIINHPVRTIRAGAAWGHKYCMPAAYPRPKPIKTSTVTIITPAVRTTKYYTSACRIDIQTSQTLRHTVHRPQRRSLIAPTSQAYDDVRAKKKLERISRYHALAMRASGSENEMRFVQT